MPECNTERLAKEKRHRAERYGAVNFNTISDIQPLL